ncbi:hypothetical protein AMATHDRAFT_68415 [Amanita thiersii Skay4041]|uniref:C2H2-type domain-containing protein n=1 Tax=Amanita thiersii Skay4041 TaxID=703135 RepID=A0A2A9NAI6_9AGAR|nr:hypothetical protein AMATHDRAFT_68415 [Amanita thiersii Skay4041]
MFLEAEQRIYKFQNGYSYLWTDNGYDQPGIALCDEGNTSSYSDLDLEMRDIYDTLYWEENDAIPESPRLVPISPVLDPPTPGPLLSDFSTSEPSSGPLKQEPVIVELPIPKRSKKGQIMLRVQPDRASRRKRESMAPYPKRKLPQAPRETRTRRLVTISGFSKRNVKVSPQDVDKEANRLISEHSRKIKNLKCEICVKHKCHRKPPKRFSDLLRHVETHRDHLAVGNNSSRGLEQGVCKQCKRLFSRKDSLGRHQKESHGRRCQ